MSHSPGGRQVHPDQTKAVKGQNGKTLATAGAIKRLLPCPVQGIGKKNRVYFREWKEKTEQEEKKKDKKENREEKKGN